MLSVTANSRLAVSYRSQLVCRFMLNLGKVLEGIQEDVPAHAQAVAEELLALLLQGKDKLQKYADRGRISKACSVHSEKVRMPFTCERGPNRVAAPL